MLRYSLHIRFDSRLLRLLDQDGGIVAAVSGQQNMFTFQGHLIPSLIFPGVCVCINLSLYSLSNF